MKRCMICARSGYLSSRIIASTLREHHGYGSPAHTTIHQVFTRPELPKPSTLLGVVSVLAGAVRSADTDAEFDRFDSLWQRAFDDQSRRRSGHEATTTPTAAAKITDPQIHEPDKSLGVRPMRIGVYVDAFNVYYGARGLCGKHTTSWKWIDLAGLAMGMINPGLWPDAELVILAYCSALHCTALRNREGDPTSITDQTTYIDALCHHTPETTVSWGKYVPRVKTGVLVDSRVVGKPKRVTLFDGEPLPAWSDAKRISGAAGGHELLVALSSWEEKGSDVNVATHLLVDVLTSKIDAAIVLSNDSGLAGPLEQARARVPVGTVNPTNRPLASDLRGDAKGGVGRHW